MNTQNSHIVHINCPAFKDFEEAKRCVTSHMRSDPDVVVFHRPKADDNEMYRLMQKVYESGHDVTLSQAAAPN